MKLISKQRRRHFVPFHLRPFFPFAVGVVQRSLLNWQQKQRIGYIKNTNECMNNRRALCVYVCMGELKADSIQPSVVAVVKSQPDNNLQVWQTLLDLFHAEQFLISKVINNNYIS